MCFDESPTLKCRMGDKKNNNSFQSITAWSYDMEGRADAETPCMDDHLSSPEDVNVTGELAPVCAQIGLTCLYFDRIGRQGLHD